MNRLQCYGSISNKEPSSSGTKLSSFTSESESSTTAGSTPLENNGSSEMMGIAVFSNDKLVGELTAKETLCYSLIANEVDSCNISIPNTESPESNIDLYIFNNSQPKIDIDIVNGSPFIKIKLKLEARILSVDDNTDYSTKEKLSEISQSANKYIENMIIEYLYKTSIKLKSDVNGFGKYALQLFLTEPDFEKYNWLACYKDSIFDVTVDTRVKSAFLLSGGRE